MTAPRLRAIAAHLVCPDCRRPLEGGGEAGFACSPCAGRFPVVDGVPFLLPAAAAARFQEVLDGEGRAMAAEYRANGWRRLLARLRPPSLLLPLEPALAAPEMDFLYRDGDRPRVVLSVGGGPARHRAEEINLNIAPFPNVDLVADGHRLPLADASVDTVICKAVLEHVEDPGAVVAEIARVLRPGGLVYLDIPFLFIEHAYPSDFTRFTSSGVRNLARAFEVLRLGPSVGPFSTILLLANEFLLEALRLRGRSAGKVVSAAFRALLFPLKYLDLLYRAARPTMAFAGAYHLIGRKGCTPTPGR